MHFPPRELALRLPASKLAGYLLLRLLERWRGDGRGCMFKGLLPPDALRDVPVRIAYAEGWSWLVGEGLIVPDQNPDLTSESPYMVPSRRALELDGIEAFERLKRGALVPRDLVDERIHLAAEADLFAGETDTAVLKALRVVEIAVRKASGLEDMYGVALMRGAFHPTRGPLRDPSRDADAREAMAQMFAAPFTLYSNPTRHREVGLPPERAVEVLVLASHLLRIAEERGAAGAQPPDSGSGSSNKS